MTPSRKPAGPHRLPAEQDVRNQEVLRANKELAAYFKGSRTEREARAALKIIKAFIRDRERVDPSSRPALPLVTSTRSALKISKRNTATSTKKARRRIATQPVRKNSSQAAGPAANAEQRELAPTGNNGT